MCVDFCFGQYFDGIMALAYKPCHRYSCHIFELIDLKISECFSVILRCTCDSGLS